MTATTVARRCDALCVRPIWTGRTGVCLNSGFPLGLDYRPCFASQAVQEPRTWPARFNIDADVPYGSDPYRVTDCEGWPSADALTCAEVGAVVFGGIFRYIHVRNLNVLPRSRLW